MLLSESKENSCKSSRSNTEKKMLNSCTPDDRTKLGNVRLFGEEKNRYSSLTRRWETYSINPCCWRPNQRLQEKKMKLHPHLLKTEPNRGVQLHQDPNQIKEISRLILQEEKAAGDRRKWQQLQGPKWSVKQMSGHQKKKEMSCRKIWRRSR